MFVRTPQLVAFILMLIISLQSIAAANMSVCNSIMQFQSSEQNATGTSCHEQMTDMSKAVQNEHGCIDKSTGKKICSALCASLSAMTAIPTDIRHAVFSRVSSSSRMLHQSYTSISLPNPQRPPIPLS